jgi:hypothetical protein
MGRMHDRIEDLRHDAEIDGVPFSEGSVEDMLVLVKALDGREPDSIWHEDEGHLRVNWRRPPDGGSVSIDVFGGGAFLITAVGRHHHGSWRASSIQEVLPVVQRIVVSPA